MKEAQEAQKDKMDHLDKVLTKHILKDHGGGGGYYGGGNGGAYEGSAGGGSGYINTSLLTNAKTIDGNTSFTAPGGGNETGHSGNGYARITNMN